MRCERCKHFGKIAGNRNRNLLGLVAGVGENHHLRNGCVKAQTFNIIGNLLDCLVQFFYNFAVVLQTINNVVFLAEEAEHARKEVEHALHATLGPRFHGVERSHKHLVKTKAVGSVVGNHIVGVNHILERFRHLGHNLTKFGASLLVVEFAVALFNHIRSDFGSSLCLVGESQNHSLIEQFLIRLVGVDNAQIVQNLVPETAVEQVKHGVLGTAHIQIDRHPVVFGFNRERRRVVCWVGVAQIVPARTCPLRHCVGLVAAAATILVGNVEPVGGVSQRRLASIARLVFGQFGQFVRKVLLIDHRNFAVFPVNDWERLAPVALAAEQPVADFIVDCGLAQIALGKPGNHLVNGVFLVQTVKEARIDVHAVFGPGLLLHIDFRFQNFDNRQVEFLGKLPVACVVGGHGHNCASSVAHQHVIGHPNRYQCAVYGIFSISAREHASLLLCQLGAVQIRFHRSLFAILVNSRFLVGGDNQVNHRVLGRDNHIGGAEQGVAAGGVDSQFGINAVEFKIDFGTR